MSNFTLFHESPIAQLFVCSEGVHFALLLGNVQIFQTRKELDKLADITSRYLEQVEYQPCRACKPFIIDTPLKNLQLRFSYHELGQLHHFLHEALFLIEVEGLLYSEK